MDIKSQIKKFNIDAKGVIHVGAHLGTEIDIYRSLGIKNMILFEPIPDIFNKLTDRINNTKLIDENIRLINKALGSSIDRREMWIESANGGMSSSLLKPMFHTIQYPWITFDTKIEVDISTLDIELSQNTEVYNILNIDVQGYELEVLKGSSKSLKEIELIFLEVNAVKMYDSCSLVDEIDYFLRELNFYRRDTDWYKHEDIHTWGDAVYVKYN